MVVEAGGYDIRRASQKLGCSVESVMKSEERATNQSALVVDVVMTNGEAHPDPL